MILNLFVHLAFIIIILFVTQEKELTVLRREIRLILADYQVSSPILTYFDLLFSPEYCNPICNTVLHTG